MVKTQVQVRSLPRTELPADVDITSYLVSRLRDAVARGHAKPVAVVLRQRTLDVVPVDAIQTSGIPIPWFLAGLTRSATPAGGSVEAVAVVGAMDRRASKDADPVRVGVVFVEWQDNRWWQWQCALDGRSQLREETVIVRSAMDGDALPSDFGRWWTMGRRNQVELGMQAVAADPSGGVVH